MRGHHDMGGLPAGTVEPVEHEVEHWEKRVDALMTLLSGKHKFTVDELRRGIESLGADAYERMSYYERWIASIADSLIHRGTLTIDELGRKMAEVEARENKRP
ncbi:MAG TPA: hypothetical protein VEU47_02980 [Candidatus Cybelea sp.]|nr:hypothetical protein [Candidatus Cybelea sp.]